MDVTTIVNGSSIVILNGMVSVKAFYDALDKKGVNALCLPPAFLRILWQLSGDRLGKYANQIDFVECSTSPLTEDDKDTLRRQLPYSCLYNNYGLSECGAMAMYDFNEFPDKKDGCGGKLTVNSHIAIMDENRKEIQSSKDHPGLISNSGPANMKGYWKNSKLTAEVMDDTWLYTNDLGYFDEDGFLHVIGRKNDTINVGGLKVAPTEVEDAVQVMREIQDCICIPVDDELTGSALKLFVVPADGYDVDPAKIQRYLYEKFGSCMVPKYIEKIDAIPRNYIGKPGRNAFINGKLKETKP